MTAFISKEEAFPVIDFSEFDLNPDKVSRELFQAACRWGFLVLTGHGIPQEDVDTMFSMVSSADVFHKREIFGNDFTVKRFL